MKSSNIMVSSSTSMQPDAKYDVIISYEGKDLKTALPNVLCKLLVKEGFSVKRDSAFLLRGRDRTFEFQHLIEQSRASLIILSDNFTKSVYSLKKLSIMVKQSEKNGHFIFLMDVRKDKRSLNIGVEENTTKDNEEDWKAALSYVLTDKVIQIEYSQEVETYVKNSIKEISSKLTTITKFGVEGKHRGEIFVSTKEIAKGKDDTIVFEGFFGRIKAAVKVKRLAGDKNAIDNEAGIDGLMAWPVHQNTVRCFGREGIGGLLYIAMELCDCTLADLVQGKNTYKFPLFKGSKNYPSTYLLDLMRNIIAGLDRLHELNIIHGDLIAENVLIAKDDYEERLCAKLSTCGGRRRLVRDKSSWDATIDMLALGRVFFFCMTGGGNLDDDMLSVGSLFAEANDLLRHLLLYPLPKLRPKELLGHPLLWNSEKRLNFFSDASDSYTSAISEDLEALQNKGREAFPAGCWDAEIHKEFMNYMNNKSRVPYTGDVVKELLRFIRNAWSGYRSSSSSRVSKVFKAYLGSSTEEVDDYFRNRFPNLLMLVMKIQQVRENQGEWFDEYKFNYF